MRQNSNIQKVKENRWLATISAGLFVLTLMIACQQRIEPRNDSNKPSQPSVPVAQKSNTSPPINPETDQIKTEEAPQVQQPSILTAPSNLTLTLSGNDDINVRWDDNSENEDGFILEHSTDQKAYKVIKVFKNSDYKYVAKGVLQGKLESAEYKSVLVQRESECPRFFLVSTVF